MPRMLGVLLSACWCVVAVVGISIDPDALRAAYDQQPLGGGGPSAIGLNPSPFETSSWAASGGLVGPASHATVMTCNASIYVIGGCKDVNCTVMSNRSHQYSVQVAGPQRPPQPLPELTYSIAGRGAAVALQDLIYVVHMCGYISMEDARQLNATSMDKFRRVEVIDSLRSTISMLDVNITDARANATCLHFNSAISTPAIFVFGGIDLETMKITDRISLILLESDGPMYYKDAGKLPRPAMNMAGFSTTVAMYIVAGHADLHGAPLHEHYTVIPSATIGNLPLCIYKSATLPNYNLVHGLNSPWNDIQMVGYADFHLVLVNEGTFLAMYDLGTASWSPVPVSPTVFKPNETIWKDRRGSTLALVPFWLPPPNASSNSAVQVVLFSVGGLAQVNKTIPVTPAPTTPTPPTTTTSVPTTTITTTAPPTTTATTTPAPPPSPTTTPAPPTPTPNVSLASLMLQRQAFRRVFDGKDLTELPPVTTTAPTNEPNVIVETEEVLLANVTYALTSITLPSASVTTTRLNVTSTLVFNLTSSSEFSDGTHEACFANPELSNCQIATAKDASCFIKTRSVGPIVNRHVAINNLNTIGVDNPFWLCFTFGRQSVDPLRCPRRFAFDESRLPYFVMDFFNPFIIDALPPPPTPAPPTPSNGPMLNNGATVALVTVAIVLFIGLVVVAVVLVRRRSGGNLSGHSERYTELEEIGRGAFGRVLRVKRNSDGAIFAKKHIDCPHAEVLQEALKEFELLRTLQAHPNIIRVVDMFLNYEVVSAPPIAADRDSASPLLGRRRSSRLSNNGNDSLAVATPTRHLCIVMDYHPRKDLKLWALAHPSHIPEAILCHIAVQTCSVLSFIHQKNVIHRDLKPENILIVSDDPLSGGGGTSIGSAVPTGNSQLLQQVVITDFGLAHLVADSRNVGFVGTAVYSAPECVALLLRGATGGPPISPTRQHEPTPNTLDPSTVGAVNVTPRAHLHVSKTTSKHHRRTSSMSAFDNVTSQCDIWSLGCVLYAVATKRLERSNVRKMFEDVKRPEFGDMIASDLTRLGYSRAFANFLIRLLHPDPRERPAAKDALKYFRKSNRDGSYSVADTMKFTAQEKQEMARRQRERDAAAAAAAGGGATGSNRTFPSRPGSKTSQPTSQRRLGDALKPPENAAAPADAPAGRASRQRASSELDTMHEEPTPRSPPNPRSPTPAHSARETPAGADSRTPTDP